MNKAERRADLELEMLDREIKADIERRQHAPTIAVLKTVRQRISARRAALERSADERYEIARAVRKDFDIGPIMP